MKNVPESVQKVIEAAAVKHCDDIEKAVKEAERLIRKMPEYDDFVGSLITNCVQELIYDARHSANVRIKRQTGYYGKEAKTVVGDSEVIHRAYQSVYDYCIGAKTLGSLMGSELPVIAEQEEMISNGHKTNAALLRWLTPQVSDSKTVRECVPEKKIRAAFDRIKKEYGQAA